MLQKHDNLEPFFEEPNNDFSMREYSRKQECGTSKAIGSLKYSLSQNHITKTTNRKYHLYKLNKQNPEVKTLAQLYWGTKLRPLIQKIKDKANPTAIILIKEIAELTNTKETPITLLLFKATTSTISVKEESTKLGRSIKLIRVTRFSSLPTSYKSLVFKGLLLSGEIE